MSDNKKIEESLEFVTRYYEDGTLMPRQGWHRFKLTHTLPTLRRNIAAACIGAVVLVASASIYYITMSNTTESTVNTETTLSNVEETPATNLYTIVKIQFTDASLSDVVKEIEQIYGVKVTNIPEEEIRLTISYEGNAYDVIEIINDLLGTDLKIEETTDNETTE